MKGYAPVMAMAWWLPAVLAFACSSGGGKSASQAAGWLSMTLSAPTGGPQCSGAASTPYDFGSAASPLVGQASCTVHSDQNDAWVSCHLGDSLTSAGGKHLRLTIH